jgi:fluoride exporter
MSKLFWIATGGALGAVFRYGVVSVIYRILGAGFPWGTFAVNAIGSLMIGALWAIAERTPLTDGWSAFLFIGVLGAFTTFSTFAIETANLMRDGRMVLGIANILLSNATCILLAFAGLSLGRYLTAA